MRSWCGIFTVTLLAPLAFGEVVVFDNTAGEFAWEWGDCTWIECHSQFLDVRLPPGAQTGLETESAFQLRWVSCCCGGACRDFMRIWHAVQMPGQGAIGEPHAHPIDFKAQPVAFGGLIGPDQSYDGEEIGYQAVPIVTRETEPEAVAPEEIREVHETVEEKRPGEEEVGGRGREASTPDPALDQKRGNSGHEPGEEAVEAERAGTAKDHPDHSAEGDDGEGEGGGAAVGS